MKILLFMTTCIAALAFTTTSCRFASSPTMGDTIAASVFQPADTSRANHKIRAKQQSTATQLVDSIGLYYIGSGSTKEYIQLVSYPSRRDTSVYGKTRHLKVKGSAEINNVVRVKYYLLNGRDSLVREVEQVKELK